jgi:hypothetical protein
LPLKNTLSLDCSLTLVYASLIAATIVAESELASVAIQKISSWSAIITIVAAY